MCGRYAQFRDADDLVNVFRIQLVTPDAAELLPSWNVAPTQAVRIVRDATDVSPAPIRTLELARWGLVPHWAKDPAIGSRMINARSETVAEKPSYRGPIRYSRCVVVADGYYEWQAPEAGRRLKTPHYIYRADGGVIAFAGMYSLWREELMTCTILTRAARAELAELHEREPVILNSDVIDSWLDPAIKEPEEAISMLELAPPELTHHVVSTEVNAVRNNAPHLIEPATLL
ncbi:Putative SOS response-associated peptidase YedK [Bowdeniella nasicola]|uniref:Abasic site processing protein n=1 Tax=Bowdeniella nasicola TaxID=208480 RepID=A0A1H4DIR3_9ACTO|nr:SOS response-associated peptidase [Bowdeniella nasicola]SEA72428.1 Putative SOS response-associated peptidase YedK [Bowdeniella nasicola]